MQAIAHVTYGTFPQVEDEANSAFSAVEQRGSNVVVYGGRVEVEHVGADLPEGVARLQVARGACAPVALHLVGGCEAKGIGDEDDGVPDRGILIAREIAEDREQVRGWAAYLTA